jgi:hypothetical protein
MATKPRRRRTPIDNAISLEDGFYQMRKKILKLASGLKKGQHVSVTVKIVDNEKPDEAPKP